MTTAAEKHRFLPIAIGAVALLVGAVIGLRTPASEPSVGSASASGAAAVPSASGSAGTTAASAGTGASSAAADEAALSRYQPDLSGPTVGRRLTEQGAGAHQLHSLGDRIAWLDADGKVGAARFGEGGAIAEQLVLRTPSDDDDVGVALALTDDSVYWVVKRGDAQRQAIERQKLPSDAGASLSESEQVAFGRSPDHLAVNERGLSWSDTGRLGQRLAGASESTWLHEGSARIVSLWSDAEGWHWLAAPYEGSGAHQLLQLQPSDAEPRERARLPARSRANLCRSAAGLVWSEAPVGVDNGRESIMILRPGQRKASRLAVAGLVVAMQLSDESLWWAELHERDGGVDTLLRRAVVGSGVPPRPATLLGRVAGRITAVARRGPDLLWSDEAGIAALPLAATAAADAGTR